MLSENTIADLFNGTVRSNQQTLNLQVLDLNSKLINSSHPMQVTLSDGKWRSSFNVLSSLSLKMSNEIRQYDILSVKVIFNQSQKTASVVSFSIQETGISTSIGNPESILNYENATKIQNSMNNRMNANVDTGRPRMNNYAQDEDEDDITEISNLTPYDQDWKIKGRVTKKTQTRTFKTRDGADGCVFNIHILDESNNRIQGVFFTEAARTYETILQIGKIFTFKGGEIKKVRNPKFNTTGNDLEIFFNERSKIVECISSDVIPNFFYNFISLSEVEAVESGESVDILAIVHECGDPTSITLKSGEEKMKNNINLIDESGVVCQLTLWGEQALEIKPKVNEIIGFSELKVRDYRGKQLGFSYNSKVIDDNLRDLPKYRQLLHERNRGVNVSKNISEFQNSMRICKKVSQIDQEAKSVLNDNYESKETKLYFDVHAQISFIKDKISYPSCPNDNCKKKVIKNFSDQYDCARCNQTYDQPTRNIYLYIVYPFK